MAHVYKIDGIHYHSEMYNFNLDVRIQITDNLISQAKATQLVKERFIEHCGKFAHQIQKVQNFIRFANSKKKVENLRKINKISSLVSGHYVITFCKYSNGKTLLIA